MQLFIGKSKASFKKLQEQGYIKKIRTGNNLFSKANSYKVLNLQPVYKHGVEVSLSMVEQDLSDEEFDELLIRGKGVAYYYYYYY